MTKKSRTILFFICLFLFLLASPLAVLYSQGYRLNLNPEEGGKIITKTGGFFIKVLPKQSEIYLNGGLKEKTDFFFGSILIKNLLPKKYAIEVKKEGFLPWKKTLEIKEKEVTEAEAIILFRENINFSQLLENETSPFEKELATTSLPENTLAYQKLNNQIYYWNASGTIFSSDFSLSQKQKIADSGLLIKKGPNFGFKISPDAKKIAYFYDHEIWILYLQDVWKQPSKKAGQQDLLARFSEKINDLAWLNSDYLALSAGNKIKITEIDNRDRLNLYDLAEFAAPKIIFSATDNKLYILSEKKVYSSPSLF